MPKTLSGWIVDFRTARSIVSSGSNARIDHCVEQVAAGNMKICHSEASDFAGVPALKNIFGGSVEQADDSVLAKCAQLQGTGYFPGAGKFDLTPIYIVAIALVRNYGVLCDQRITPFVTTYSACCNFNVTVKRAQEYFSFLQ